MSTTISGTAATAAGSATLNSVRDRIRVQLELAGGFTEPEVVSSSSLQLSSGTPNFRDRVEARLQDSGNSRWSTGDLDEAIRSALEYYSRKNPARAIATLTLSSGGREIDISSITGLLRVEKVWWDYDSTTPGYPPNWRQFEVWPGSVLYIDDRQAPSSGDVIRIWYNKKHTINGLDSAAATTIPQEDEDVIVTGAAHFAAQQRAIELTETVTVDEKVYARLKDWAEEQGTAFRYGVRQKPPAWQRYAYSYGQDDIDEAIRWALHRITDAIPDETITTVTLSSDGREVDISSITDYLDILRVWVEYDSADPDYPPEWREFETWPGDLLFIRDGDEPQSGDVIRIFYTRPHTLSGLDSATVTSISDRDTELLVVGGSGFAAQERVQEQPTRWVPRKLREWADARLGEFENGLKRLKQRHAARHSGIAPVSPLDRWHRDADGWA